MAKNLLCVVLLMFTLICVLTSCGHEHEFGEWQTVKKPTCEEEGTEERRCNDCEEIQTRATDKLDQHTFSNGNCTSCNLSIVTAIGNVIKQNPDQYSAGAYLKSFDCSNFSSKDDAHYYGLGFAYDENSRTLLIQLLAKFSAGTKQITVIISNGVVANNYEYSYSNTNYYSGYTDEIQGVFNATSLSSTSAFTYKRYSAGSGQAFSWFVSDYKEGAAEFTKLLIEYLDEFLNYNNLGFTSREFNFN